MPGTKRGNTTRRSPTTPRRSGSIPRYASAYEQRGLAWHTKQEYDKAIADYSEAIRLDPKESFVYQFRGETWCAGRSTTRRSRT